MAVILMLDDEEDSCRLMARVFSEFGHQIEAFGDAADALRWLRANKADLALLDLRLRDKDGMDVLQFIHEHHPDTKSIIISGNLSREKQRQAAELGASEYLFKPVEIGDLEASVNRLLGVD